MLMIGEISQANTYISMICTSLIMVGMQFTNFARSFVSIKRVNEILLCDLEIKEGHLENVETFTQGEIEFKNVSFKYENAHDYVLDNISFKIKKGETIAIVGATGAGKTTLINLIPRFYDYTSGEILLNGINVRDYKLEELRKRISVCLQRAELFSGTIRENIIWGKEDATEEEILEAAEISQSLEIINNKPNKFDEYIEERGTSLSGGQKQRISIARAIIKNPEVLIFDDSTSALDLITESKLHEGLRKKKNNVTKIIVAQRVATAKNADKIIVLDNGRIVDFDTHENLLLNCEIYKNIYESQLKRDGEINE
jgi:ATP-binding cassette subfamily B protein